MKSLISLRLSRTSGSVVFYIDISICRLCFNLFILWPNHHHICIKTVTDVKIRQIIVNSFIWLNITFNKSDVLKEKTNLCLPNITSLNFSLFTNSICRKIFINRINTANKQFMWLLTFHTMGEPSVKVSNKYYKNALFHGLNNFKRYRKNETEEKESDSDDGYVPYVPIKERKKQKLMKLGRIGQVSYFYLQSFNNIIIYQWYYS